MEQIPSKPPKKYSRRQVLEGLGALGALAAMGVVSSAIVGGCENQQASPPKPEPETPMIPLQILKIEGLDISDETREKFMPYIRASCVMLGPGRCAVVELDGEIYLITVKHIAKYSLNLTHYDPIIYDIHAKPRGGGLFGPMEGEGDNVDPLWKAKIDISDISYELVKPLHLVPWTPGKRGVFFDNKEQILYIIQSYNDLMDSTITDLRGQVLIQPTKNYLFPFHKGVSGTAVLEIDDQGNLTGGCFGFISQMLNPEINDYSDSGLITPVLESTPKTKSILP